MKTINKIKICENHNIKSIKINHKTYYVCNICGRLSNKAIHADGKIWCNKHYKQQKRYHKTIDNSPRTIYDKNEICIDGDTCYINLYDKNGNLKCIGKFDTEDLEKVRYFKWQERNGYIATTGKRRGSTYFMHRLVLDTDCFVDHINHNTLDNRKCNLRIVNKSQNAMNTNFKGVTQTLNGKYYAHIKINQKMINLGTYIEEAEAYFARWYAEKILFKEHRFLKEKPQISQERETQIIEYVNRKVQRL